MADARPLLSVAEALSRVTTSLAPKGRETVPIAYAHRRVLSSDLSATRDQPPHATSAMDGYAVRADDVGVLPATLRVIGTAPAGHAFKGSLDEGEAVRIFTGGIMPAGADAIVIQENTRVDGDRVTVVERGAETRYVRARGLDFQAGQTLLTAGTRLRPRHVALAAAMNRGEVEVWRRPQVGILATGDELRAPGSAGPGEIATSNSYGLVALVETMGGVGINLGIAEDTREALNRAFEAASGLDLLVTIGGASVGEHDLVRDVLGGRGLNLDFWRIAMRPGKPLMHGAFADDLGANVRFLGLPGNPVSSLVCGQVFLKPMLAALCGHSDTETPFLRARLGSRLKANDERQDYLRARLSGNGDGLIATPFERQDSSMLSNLALADGFIVRAPLAPAAEAGESVDVLAIDI